jgi:hypothetical protein
MSGDVRHIHPTEWPIFGMTLSAAETRSLEDQARERAFRKTAVRP